MHPAQSRRLRLERMTATELHAELEVARQHCAARYQRDVHAALRHRAAGGKPITYAQQKQELGR